MIGWSQQREDRRNLRDAAVAVVFACIIGIVVAQCAEIKVSENPVPVYSFAVVKLDGINAGDKVDIAWEVYPKPTKVEEDGATLRLSGPPGAEYSIVADVIDWKAQKRTKFKATVTIAGGVTPVPPTPVPPGPTPIPPTPVPVPVDQFTTDMIAAYAKEPATFSSSVTNIQGQPVTTIQTRLQSATVLAAMYRNAADSTVKDPTVKTNADLFNIMDSAFATLSQQGKWPKGALPFMRTVVGARLTGTPDKPGSMRSAGIIDREFATKELRAVADAITAAAK